MRRASRPVRLSRTRDPVVSAGMAAAAIALRADLVAAEVSGAFRSAGIRTILLRGPSIAGHLYDSDESREYADVDLLIASADGAEAERILADRGFEHSAVLGQRADDRPPWSRTWKRADDGSEVDLHRTIVGIGAGADETWALLSEEVETIEVARALLSGMNAEATAVIVALHAAHHGNEFPQTLSDLSRAIETFPYATWQVAAAIAGRLEATPAFAAGLRLLPAGAELAQRLRLRHDAPAEVVLRAGTAPPMALGFEWLAHVPGLRAKARLVLGKLVPDPEFMRAWSPLAGRGPAGLLGAYVWRFIWLAWHAVPGFRAWRRAQKKSVQ
jgi:Uncharacterised nucleotidyltransferase